MTVPICETVTVGKGHSVTIIVAGILLAVAEKPFTEGLARQDYCLSTH